MRHLRELYKANEGGLVLWVDALCINQKDVEERTSQVQFMGKIYAQCEEVIVYLGDNLDHRSGHERLSPSANPGTSVEVERSYQYGALGVFNFLQDLGKKSSLNYT